MNAVMEPLPMQSKRDDAHSGSASSLIGCR